MLHDASASTTASKIEHAGARQASPGSQKGTSLWNAAICKSMGRNGRDALAAQIQGHVGIIVDVDSVQTLTNALEGPSLACNDLLSTPHATRLRIEAVIGKID